MAEYYRAWGSLDACVREGGSGFERAFGMPLLDYLAAHPERREVFDESMTAISATVARAMTRAHDFGRTGTVVDVGGSYGELLCRLLEMRHMLRGILNDLPEVIERARPRLAARLVGTRIELAPMDFFQGVPEGGDTYILKSVLHNWDDDHARIILQNVRRAMGTRPATLVVIERTLAPHGQPDAGTVGDVNMMMMASGCERTEAAWQQLLAEGGFRLERIESFGPTAGNLGLIAAAPT
jgi:hypothetical protein